MQTPLVVPRWPPAAALTALLPPPQLSPGSEDDEGHDGISRENLGRIQFSVGYNFQESTLTVKIMKAQELPAKDFSGTSDPFVKIYLLPDKKHKLETKVKRKNLNPHWNETFLFEGRGWDGLGWERSGCGTLCPPSWAGPAQLELPTWWPLVMRRVGQAINTRLEVFALHLMKGTWGEAPSPPSRHPWVGAHRGINPLPAIAVA